MGKVKIENKLKPEVKKTRRYLIAAVFITLYFNTQMADPFNAPKMYSLIFFSMLFAPQFFSNTKVLEKHYKISKNLILVFILALFWAFINSPSKYTALFGETQRHLGMITYLGFAIFFLLFARSTNFNFFQGFQFTIFTLSLIYIIYGLLQFTGNDFVQWVNQYNPIIGTLGNPNFSAAFMAMLFVLNFAFLFISYNSLLTKILAATCTIGLLIVIHLSNALQGTLSLAVGVMTFLIIKLFIKNKSLGFLGVVAAIIGLSYAIAGIFQAGPLSSLLYKDSVSLRGYYWRAGLSMLKENLFTGVGLDYYGAYFKSEREPIFALTRGYDLLSTNAHNVPIQIFGTGGVFLGFAYLAVIVWTFYCGIRGIRISKGNDQLIILGIFSAWITFQSQSIVSIDNIGLTIWGWIFAGIIVGLYSDKMYQQSAKDSLTINKVTQRSTNSILQLSSILSAMIAIIIIIFLSKSETNVYKLRNELAAQTSQNAQNIKYYADKVANDPFAHPTYKMQVADTYVRLGQKEAGINLAKRILLTSPNYPNYQWALANILESNSFFSEAIVVRKDLIKSDPQNINNYLQLARLYIELKNQQKAIEMKNIIISISPNSDQAKLVQKEIDQAAIINAK